MNIVMTPAAIELADALNEVTPAAIDSFFFSNSGAEAVEGAVKLARQTTGRRNIVVFQGSFHGRTAQTMAMTTSKYVYRYNYQPLPGGIVTAPFPYSYYYGWDERRDDGMVPEAAPPAAQKPDRAGRNGRYHHRAGVGRRRLRARPARLHAGAAPAVHASTAFC
jgi:4-aminobutyrate aminotransferase-like enzyme